MRTLLIHTDDLLRRGTTDSAVLEMRPRILIGIILTFSPIYGALMGSYLFQSSADLEQVVYSAVKMPLLLFATTALCLPSFFVFNTVLDLRNDFGDAMRAILTGQAGISIALASLSPFTRFFYFCTEDYKFAQIFNAAMFTLGAFAAQTIMIRAYRPLIRRRPRHRLMLAVWIVLYAFVGMQMGWMLRPFIGTPDMPPSFFRDEPFSNAYVVIFRIFFGG